MGTSRVFDVECFVGNLDSAADEVIDRARSREGGAACFANAHVLVAAQRNPLLMQALQSAWRVFPDGAPVAWCQRRTASKTAMRIAGPDLMPLVLDRGRSFDLRHVLCGSTEAVVADLHRSLMARYPGVRIVEALAPATGAEDDTHLLERIRGADPHLIWVAFGAPKQEVWAARHVKDFEGALLLTVGAAFDFHAGAKRRAPARLQRHGLEWLHRLATEPRRLGWRYLSTNAIFLARLARELGTRQARA